MKIATIVGARPQFIKAAAVSRVLRKYHNEILIHTGQHYDKNMSDIFFDELDIPRPDYNLNVGSGTHGKQTGEMLIKIEEVLVQEKPDAVIVYGDTNSTLAGALAASKLLISVIHVEAGLRSYNRNMPEEQNRVLTDHISSILFCPTQNAVENLLREGITNNVFNVGDVMYDAILFNLDIAEQKSDILSKLQLKKNEYILATVHRAENTDTYENLYNIIHSFNDSQELIVFPVHPRTRKAIQDYGIKLLSNVKVIDPVGYLDMLILEKYANKIVTDSGGIQKEAYILGVPCITLRHETEWVETVKDKWNILVGTDKEKIIEAIKYFRPSNKRKNYFGEGKAGEKIVDAINHILK
ncbi:non-hydrolyzing UDP-N-acetylglucosamine 2-epimerase [Thermoanaerobacterium sp. DL9XJH110]|uniref:non-hydrolyzing UDP-N-acetylglucosamine 2-epimerase n=1 Tax=Thermoanaerobacterium sp. DL9XJH110 TaxID=3386643 RepID=UPI003BB5AD62